MSKIQVQYNTTAVTLYALVRDADGNVWNGSAFVAYVTANLGAYDLPMAEQGTASRYYTVDFPSAIVAGVYAVTVFQQAGGSPAETDTVVTSGPYEWTGRAAFSATVCAARGVVAAGATTTSVPTSALYPAANDQDQFRGRIIIFDDDTATLGLRGQADTVVTSSAGGVLTVSGLSRAPASGDRFGIY